MLQVDVWAVGVLAFELIVGKPPFEVNNEAETAHMIMTSNRIPFPAKHSPLWADFVKQALEKKPHLRPTAAVLLDHPWLSFHGRKYARETGQAPAVEAILAPPTLQTNKSSGNLVCEAARQVSSAFKVVLLLLRTQLVLGPVAVPAPSICKPNVAGKGNCRLATQRFWVSVVIDLSHCVVLQPWRSWAL